MKRGGYGVNYTAMIPLMIRALQDQKQTIESLREEMKELRSKISDNTELAEVLGIEGERMTIFPNPSSRVANITLKGNTRGNVSLEVVNLNGEVVQRVAGNGSKSAEINTSEMLKGVYFVRYLRDGKVVDYQEIAHREIDRFYQPTGAWDLFSAPFFMSPPTLLWFFGQP